MHIRFTLTPPVYAVKRVLILGLPSTLLLSLDGIMLINFNAVLIPMAWLLSLTGKLNAVWLSVPVADTVAAVVGFALMLRFYRKDIKIAIGEQSCVCYNRL